MGLPRASLCGTVTLVVIAAMAFGGCASAIAPGSSVLSTPTLAPAPQTSSASVQSASPTAGATAQNAVLSSEPSPATGGTFTGAWIGPCCVGIANNNPLIAGPGHPVIEHALSQATRLLELAGKDELPEIQTATGPGNLSKSIFDLGTRTSGDVESKIVSLGDWDSLAVSKWPLSYRGDARNWRLSNQKRFDHGG